MWALATAATALLGNTAAAAAAAASRPSAVRPTRISCVGDSLTVVGSPGMTYPEQLQRILGDAYVVTELGNSGHTMLKNGLCGDSNGCQGNCSYWGTDTFRAALQSEPDIVTIMLGTNDAKHCNFDTVPADWHDPKCVGCPVQGHGYSFESDYRDMIRMFKALPTKPRVFVAVPPPLFPPNPFNMSAHVINEVYPVLIREIAREADGVIDAWSALGGADPVRLREPYGGHCGSMKELCTVDGCHPKDAGLGVIARTFAWTIEAAVRNETGGAVWVSAPGGQGGAPGAADVLPMSLWA